jgi:hypothetical protein
MIEDCARLPLCAAVAHAALTLLFDAVQRQQQRLQ